MRSVVAGVIVAVLSCAGVAAEAATAANLSAEQARQLLSARGMDAGLVILDVRTPAEFASGHLANAVNLDALGKDFESRLASLDRGKTYLVYCRSGNRSQKAVDLMERLGFSSIYHLKDGLLGWGRP